MITLHSYTHDTWIAPEQPLTEIASAVTGKPVAQIGTTVRDFAGVLDHARNVGGPALRAMTFHSRARLLKGAIQLIVGPTGDLFDHLSGQDVVSFTGSASTAEKLQRHPVVARESVRFIAERDSLNAAMLGPDAAPGAPEFDLFIREIVREMTVKAGQKCTAIRRALVPVAHIDAAQAALQK